MSDRENVIKGLECCIRHGENAEVGCGRKDECPYEKNGLKCWLDLNRDALAMLKKQEEEIKTLAAFARADGINVDMLLGRSVK